MKSTIISSLTFFGAAMAVPAARLSSRQAITINLSLINDMTGASGVGPIPADDGIQHKFMDIFDVSRLTIDGRILASSVQMLNIDPKYVCSFSGPNGGFQLLDGVGYKKIDRTEQPGLVVVDVTDWAVSCQSSDGESPVTRRQESYYTTTPVVPSIGLSFINDITGGVATGAIVADNNPYKITEHFGVLPITMDGKLFASSVLFTGALIPKATCVFLSNSGSFQMDAFVSYRKIEDTVLKVPSLSVTDISDMRIQCQPSDGESV